MPDKGRLKVQVIDETNYNPLKDAKITVIQKYDESRQQLEEILFSDSSGVTDEVDLVAPPVDNSMNPSEKPPYSLCDVKIEMEGYKDIIVNGCQIYPDRLAIQNCYLEPLKRGVRQQQEVIDIKPNTLYGNYPPKIPEDPDKPLPPPPSGYVKLPEPVVPEFIVVHDGSPNNPAAKNYTMRYKDYIKNVASSEIYATWPDSTIRANVYCIISFTLNRIYSEWYRGKGKNFDITSSTAFDHAFVYRRNVYGNITKIVDEIFSTYVKRWTKEQPLLTQYCDGQKVKCPGWLTQWGSKYLGDKGEVPYEILTHFYGKNIEFKKAKKVSGIPKSYPGYRLSLGSSGSAVRTIQSFLNRISKNFPAVPKSRVDGVYGEQTKKAVTEFQKIFNLSQTGVVGYSTWYKISDIYVAVTKIAELRGTSVESRIFIPHTPYRDIDNIPTIEYPYDY